MTPPYVAIRFAEKRLLELSDLYFRKAMVAGTEIKTKEYREKRLDVDMARKEIYDWLVAEGWVDNC